MKPIKHSDAELWACVEKIFSDSKLVDDAVKVAYIKGTGLLDTCEHGIKFVLFDSTWLMEKHDRKGLLVLGGHDLRYHFVPKNTIYLDADYWQSAEPPNGRTRKLLFIAFHEHTEHELMEINGADYDDGSEECGGVYQKKHDTANKEELKKREEND
jgi:hypothetical protein